MPDVYYDYESMASAEAGHYTVSYRLGTSPYAITAVHGGLIEPHTSAIAAAIAGTEHSLYVFEGHRPGGRNNRLHINSHKITEPAALYVASRARYVVSVHGCQDREAHDIYLGGLHEELKALLKARLTEAGFAAIYAQDSADEYVRSHFCGNYAENICNRGQSGQGLQLELTRRLRSRLCPMDDTGVIDSSALIEFATLVRGVLV
ncbi:poly-gamma-glutamate hydrolase family protein [bacterium]|nr:poly-gamma-glutamate hydrolase family protein [bacterium]